MARCSAGAGFTYRQSTAGITEDLVQPTANPIAATATDNSNNDPYGMSMAAFKPLSGSLSGPVLPPQGSQVVNSLSTLVITNTAAVVNTNQVTTNTIVFNYANRSAFTNDGWSFIATNPDGTPRNTETNPAVMYNQPSGSLAVPVDQGDLFGTSYDNTRNSLFRNLPTNWVSMRVQLSLNPTVDVDQAHLSLYQDDNNYIGVGLAYNDSLGGEVVTMVTETNGQDTHFWTIVNWYEGGPQGPQVTNIFLRLDNTPNSSAISGFASLDGTNWALVGTFNQGLVNPRVALWTCSSTVPYTNGISPICYWQQLNTFMVTPGPSLTYQLVNPPTGANIDTNGIITWTPTAQQGAAAYTIETVVTENTLTATNNCTVTVQAPLTVTANNQTRAYGQTNAPLTGTLVGVLNGDNITATYTTTAATNSPVGTYLIVPTLNDPNNRLGFYNVTTNFGSLTVTGAVLTATANNATRTYGATNPVFTVSYTGFVNGDGTNVLSGAPVLMTGAVTNSPVGNYVITNTIGTLVATNYTVSLANGSLTVTKAGLTLTAVGNTKTYDGTTNALATPTVSGLQRFRHGDGSGGELRDEKRRFEQDSQCQRLHGQRRERWEQLQRRHGDQFGGRDQRGGADAHGGGEHEDLRWDDERVGDADGERVAGFRHGDGTGGELRDEERGDGQDTECKRVHGQRRERWEQLQREHGGEFGGRDQRGGADAHGGGEHEDL